MAEQPEGEEIVYRPRERLKARSMSRLRHLTCGLCDQRLDRLKRSQGNCSAIYPEGRQGCDWHAYLNRP